MSKYIKLADVKEAFAENYIVSSREAAEEIVSIIRVIKKRIINLPTIEVGEDKEFETERLDFVKKIIETHIDDALCGIFFTRNIVGDRMIHLDKQFGIDIEICYEYEYFEIFGLTDHEQIIIESFYDRLNTERRTND